MATVTYSEKTGKRPFLAEEERTYGKRMDGTLARKRKRFRLIDVFSGAGGMTLGFSKICGHAFEPVWANDFSKPCVDTYNANFGDHCVLGDITEILNEPKCSIPKANLVIGGPPCQGFSLLNKKRHDDCRKALWKPFFEVVRRSGAQVFVMENVPQLLGSFEHGDIVGTAETLGFKVTQAILCAADYGVPQTRRRVIIVGCKFFEPSQVFPPRKTHFDPRKGGAQTSLLQADSNGYLPGAVKWRTVRDAVAEAT